MDFDGFNTQVIYASSVPGTPKGFGISIASGVDIDGNTYNDLAVGAYLAGKVYIFKVSTMPFNFIWCYPERLRIGPEKKVMY